MRKLLWIFMLVSLVALNVATPKASAQLSDGTHTVNYQVNKPESSSPSIANDYFAKPAKVTVKNGVATIQITLKNSAWISKFQPPGGVTIISEDKSADTRIVQFTVKDLSKPVIAAMKIDIEDINYHHEYSVSLVFNDTSTTTSSANVSPTSNATTTLESQVSNPQTNDATPYLLILAFAGSAFLLYRNKIQRKTEAQ